MIFLLSSIRLEFFLSVSKAGWILSISISGKLFDNFYNAVNKTDTFWDCYCLYTKTEWAVLKESTLLKVAVSWKKRLIKRRPKAFAVRMMDLDRKPSPLATHKPAKPEWWKLDKMTKTKMSFMEVRPRLLVLFAVLLIAMTTIPYRRADVWKYFCRPNR